MFVNTTDDFGLELEQLLGISNCSVRSSMIHPNDTCPGLCYKTFKDDEKVIFGLAVFIVLLLYNLLYFGLKRRGEKVVDNITMQWAAVIVQGRPQDTKQPVTAIQTMRGSLQGVQAFSAAAGAVAVYGLLVNDPNQHNRVLFMYMAIANWGAVYFFAEQMRGLNHIAYFAVRSRALCKEQVPAEFLDYLQGILDAPEDETEGEPVDCKFGNDPEADPQRALACYMCDDRIAPFVPGKSLLAYRLNLETFFPPEFEISRIADGLSEAFSYFSLGQRAFMSAFPFYFGLLGDYYMLGATVFLILFHICYYDDLLDREGGSMKALKGTCSKFCQRAAVLCCCCKARRKAPIAETEEGGEGEARGDQEGVELPDLQIN